MLIVVSDASPLIGFARINILDLLFKLFDQVIIPQTVADECSLDISKPGAIAINNAINNKQISIHNKEIEVNKAMQTILGAGEAAAITLAKTLDSLLLIDEKLGRTVAQQQRIKIIGTGGVLLFAKEQGLIKHIKPILMDLKSHGYRLADQLSKQILELAGEEA